MKLLGLIGGTSWHSTIEYYRLVNQMVGDRIGHRTNPPLLIYSLNIELMRSGSVEDINQEYLRIATTLQNAGAQAIVICANTPHMVYEFVNPLIDIPILHIAHATGMEAQKRGLKKLGLLGNRPTMTKGFIQSYLREHFDIETWIPEPQYIDESHNLISNQLTQGQFTKEAKNFYLEQMKFLKNRGVDGIILGCTELPILIDKDDFDLPMLATTQLHSKMAVDFIFS